MDLRIKLENSTIDDKTRYSNSREWKKGKLAFLVIENNVKVRKDICSILSPYYNCFEATNAIEAVHYLDQYRVDFIISNLIKAELKNTLPSYSIKITSLLSQLPFLILEDVLIDKQSKLSIENADYYLDKSLNKETLLEQIDQILKKRDYLSLKFENYLRINSFEIMEHKEEERKFIDLTIEIIKSNFQNPSFKVNDFAKKMGVSKSTLNKNLNLITNLSSCQFINQYRLNVAYILLLENKQTKNKTISEIAYFVGFNDPKYFSRCFSKQFNMAPSEIFKD